MTEWVRGSLGASPDHAPSLARGVAGFVRKVAQPVDFASLAAFRILFGLAMAVAMVRALVSGWAEEVLVRPDFFFKYAGFAWVPVPSGPVLQALLAGLAACALCIAVGLFYRPAAVLFLVGFSWVQLMDLTNYLNHYYLVVLLSGLLVALPLGRFASLDAWRRPDRALAAVPVGWVWLLRCQLAVVYVHAGLAKATSDWLLHGQPLGIWLASRTDTPVLGPLFALDAAPLVMSWAGFLYDLTIVGWLLWPRTRRFAYLAVLAFHGVTQILFDIGMFPTIMVTSTLIFFAPDWPRRWLGRRWAPTRPAQVVRLGRPWLVLALAWCAFQALFPLRSHLLSDNVLWDERGMRFSWRVMVREKMGSVTYRVTQGGREIEVNPKTYLDWRQVAEMSGQPDHIRQLAHHIADDFRRRGPEPQVRVDAWVSLNGRAPTRLIDPDVDLVHMGPQTPWILPAPTGHPLERPVRASR